MLDEPSRFLEIHRGGTVTVTLTPDEAKAYEGPRSRNAARFRVQVVSVDDLGAELAGITESLPWLRQVDRDRALRELIASGAPRTILEHVAGTPVAAFGPTHWTVLEVVRGRWETDEPFRSDHLCADGGVVFDAALPISLGAEETLMAHLRTVPRDDPRRRERVAIALGQHDDGLTPDIQSVDRRPSTP
ncbi:hypothetical protein [Hyphomonas sp.]|uniref:hypothetical protein n=1 Tax=Hyphomonas sp. TaxID=87 RepID=UPI00391DAE6D